VIRAKDGRLEFAGSTELAVRRIARYLKITEDELEEKLRAAYKQKWEKVKVAP
jgi:hypothetical protein